MTLVLDDDLRREFDVDGHWPMLARHTVRWSEVDAYAHVNHATYLEWYEDARSRIMEAVGLGLSKDVPGPVLAKIEVQYRQPLHYRDEVLIGARVTGFRRTSLTIAYATWAAGRGLVNEASTLSVMVVIATGEKVEVPQAARRIWREQHHATGE